MSLGNLVKEKECMWQAGVQAEDRLVENITAILCVCEHFSDVSKHKGEKFRSLINILKGEKLLENIRGKLKIQQGGHGGTCL